MKSLNGCYTYDCPGRLSFKRYEKLMLAVQIGSMDAPQHSSSIRFLLFFHRGAIAPRTPHPAHWRSIYGLSSRNIRSVRSIYGLFRRIYGPYGPYMTFWGEIWPEISKFEILTKKSRFFKCPYLQFPCVQNSKSQKSPKSIYFFLGVSS